MSDNHSNNQFALEIENLTVKYGDKPVLNGVHLKVKRGDCLALIGPNGSGKTTLLKCILRIITPESGIIKIFGDTDFNKIISRIGYVPQKLEFDKSLAISVREFLSLRLTETRGWFFHKHKFIDDILYPRLKKLKIDELLDKLLCHLSGGEFQRTLIAFSLLGEPELLLLDEATEGVDFATENLVYELIDELRKQHGLTVILVSHDLSMVSRQATNVVALGNGVICCEGPPDSVLTNGALKQAYGTHFVPYCHHHK
ncbi:MAG: metal ABC transporter ATP-binding protein [Verrucomicrobiia bacterium]|jgi:zinc transport system ATP-binding protein